MGINVSTTIEVCKDRSMPPDAQAGVGTSTDVVGLEVPMAAMDVRPIEVCCVPLVERALTDEQAEELAAAYKLLADPVRLRLLSLVATAPGGEVCACDLTEPLGRSQPTVSHHLGALTEAGLLEREKRGRWAFFRVVPERLAVLRDALGAGDS
jgi:ArsR family transcriptional regulator, arsenate/arsenite/antimonite-responsive transcriptional repressor